MCDSGGVHSPESGSGPADSARIDPAPGPDGDSVIDRETGSEAGAEIGENYRDAVLSGQRWEGRRFVRCDFTDADLRELTTAGCTFDHCDFTRTDLGESAHHSTAFRTCTFDRTMLGNVSWAGCSLLGSVFVDCGLLRTITLSDCDLTLVSLAGGVLRGTNLSGMRLREANLTGTDLRSANLREADLTGATLSGTRLTDADLRGARLDTRALTAADLTGTHVDVDIAVRYAAAHGLIVH